MAHDSKEEENSKYSQVVVLTANTAEHSIGNASNAWKYIEGCRVQFDTGDCDSVFCEVISHCHGYVADSSHRLDVGVFLDDGLIGVETSEIKFADKKNFRNGQALKHSPGWSPVIGISTVILNPSKQHTIKLMMRNYGNNGTVYCNGTSMIVKLYKTFNTHVMASANPNLKVQKSKLELKTNDGNDNELAWKDIDINSKLDFEIDKEYRISIDGGRSSWIYPIKVTNNTLIFYDCVENNDDDNNEGNQDDELILGKLMKKNKSKIVSKDKNYSKYVKISRIQMK